MQNNIKVLNIIIEDRIGGPQIRIAQLAKKLKGKGIETIVAIPGNNGGFQELLKKENIKFYEINNFRRPRFTLNPIEHLKYLFSFVPAVIQLKRIIKEESIDIVHQNDIRQIQGPVAARFSNCKVVWHLQGISYPLLSKCFIPFAYFLADKIIVASDAIGNGYFNRRRKYFKKNYDIVYAPVDTKRFYPEVNSSSFKREFNLINAYPLIGMVGNFNPIKGHKYFIQAAHLIKIKYKDAKFVIVGRKLGNREDYISELKDLAAGYNLSEEDLILTGQRQDIPNILSSLDIFVLPSLSEACPMAMLEAMAMELPCIASDVGGVPEIIINKESGLLVPPKDPKAIARAIDDILNDGRKAREMGKKARERVVSEFSLDKCVQKHYELYHALLQGK